MSEQSDALNALARARGILPATPPELEYIRAPRDGEQLSSFAATAAKVIGANGLFRRDNVPCTIDPETGRIENMQPDRFRTYVERHLVPYVRRRGQYDGETRKVPVTISVSEARGCLTSDAFYTSLRRLRRVNFVRLPVMRDDGRIELLPRGYDAPSKILTLKDGLEYATDWELDRAVDFLQKLFCEFPFTDRRSLAVQFCAIVAVYGADLLPAGAKRLGFAYRSNRPRAGKGLLMQSAIVGACGMAQIQSIPESREEFRKILDTEALNASRYVVLDECGNRLADRTLTAFLTASTWGGRLMGTQCKFVVPQEAVVFVAGNNLRLSPDLAGRFLLVDLHVEEADPQARHIQTVIDDVVLGRAEMRANLLAASWALVRAWDIAGRQPASSVLRGFEFFSNVFGAIVENAGLPCPTVSPIGDADSEYEQMVRLITEMAAGVSTTRVFRFHQVIEVCRRLHLFDSRTQPTAPVEMGKSRLRSDDKSWFGKLLADRYGDAVFTLADGSQVRFGLWSRNRGRRYTVEVVSPRLPPLEPDDSRPPGEASWAHEVESLPVARKRPMRRRKL